MRTSKLRTLVPILLTVFAVLLFAFILYPTRSSIIVQLRVSTTATSCEGSSCPQSHLSQCSRRSEGPTLTEADALKLYRYNISTCAAEGTVVSNELEQDVSLRRNLQCWCSERHTSDSKNCLFRLNNAIIHKRYSAKRSQVKTIIYVHSPTSIPFNIIVPALTHVEIRGHSESGWRPQDHDKRKTVKHGKRIYRPVMTVISDTSVMMITDAMHQENFYHSFMGPSGLLQIIATRGAIDRFYTEINERIADQMSKAPEEEFARKPTDNGNDNHRFADYSLRQKIDIEMWPVARCPLKGAKAEQVDNAGRSAAHRQYVINGGNVTSYVAKEILFNQHHPMVNSPGAIQSFEFLANSLGFCEHLLPSFSYTSIEGQGNDLWIGKLSGPTGPLMEVRREHHSMHLAPEARRPRQLSWYTNGSSALIHPSTSDRNSPTTVDVTIELTKELINDPLLFAHQSLKSTDPDPILMDEFASLCPIEEEEALVARWAVRKMESILTEPVVSVESGSPAVTIAKMSGTDRCTKVSRRQNKNEEVFCVQVSGRSLKPLPARTRGLPPNIEIAILDALLAPLDSATLPLPTTPQDELNVSKWWSRSSNERSASCSSRKQRPTSPPQTAAEILEDSNYDSGLAPCAAPPQAVTDQARAQYPNASGAFHVYEGLAFRNTSKWFDASTIRRTDYTMHVKEQFQVVKQTNLFIFEEGASATWSLFAPHGSTFIIIYNSNVKRIDMYMGQAYDLAYQLSKYTPKQPPPVGQQVPFTLQHVSENVPHTEHFLFQPEITQNVRSIFLIYQDGRFPSFAKLREVFDWPWRPESIFIGCECNETRIAPYSVVHGVCKPDNLQHTKICDSLIQ